MFDLRLRSAILPLFTFLALLCSAPYVTSGMQDQGAAEAVSLRCKVLENLLGTNDSHPRFSWEMQGTRRNAYQIWIGTTADSVALETGELWNSGKVTSAQSIGIGYGGSQLRSGQRHYWAVKNCDGNSIDEILPFVPQPRIYHRTRRGIVYRTRLTDLDFHPEESESALRKAAGDGT